MRTLLLCCLALVAGCSGKPDPSPDGTGGPSGTSGSPAPYPEVAAVTLFDAFHDNVVAADQKYRNKPLAVKGTVGRIDREGLGFDVVADGTYHGYPPSVECRFHPTRRDELAGVKKGASVTVVGTCTGSREDSRAWQKVIVTVDGCRLGK
jgi:hypothetical protein